VRHFVASARLVAPCAADSPGEVRRSLRAVSQRITLTSAVSVAAAVLAFHGIWIAAYFAAGHEARDFIKIGTSYERLSHVSHSIKVDPSYVPPRNRDAPQGTGYDGQFSYYMALDFRNARYYMDLPAYRYTRVLYPELSWVLAFGDPAILPVAMIVINWLALGLGTLALAAWLRRRACSPWLALLFGLYPGLLLGLQRDLTEPLAYALVAVGVYLFDYGGRSRQLSSGVAFGLAALARQTTIVFPLCYLVAELIRARHSPSRERTRSSLARSVAFGAFAIVPIVLYTAFLYAWLGELGKGAFLERWPFEGLFASTDWELKRQPVALVSVVAPSLLVAGLALDALRRRTWRVEFACLLANVLLFVILLGREVYTDGYTSVGRVASGIVLAGVLCIPWLRELGRVQRRALIASFALWCAMLPVIVVYGFGG
jgi:hypothetical protein